MDRKRLLALAALGLLVSSCGGSKKPIVVGSKNTTAQMLIGEIVAQHLERLLDRKVTRNLGLGDTQAVYQSTMNDQVNIYSEETGTVQSEILKESPSTDAAATLERVRNEMRRIAQLEVLDPLGVENNWSIVVDKEEADRQKIATLSDAAQAKPGWKIGVTRDFNERTDGLAALNKYRLPMGAMTRVTDPATLYSAMGAHELTMVVGLATDGPQSRHDDWKVLIDDKKVFAYYQTCLMVRSDLLANDPRIRPALVELSGKISTETLRKLAAEVDVDQKKVADVAKEFLAQAGLK